jgi:hypothetical protein
MQTLWTRALQARCSCHCASCLSRTSLAGRRATVTTASRLSLNPTLVSSTFFYSVIFAAAMVADAKVKRRRNEKWDKAIGHQRRAIAQISAREEEDAIRLDYEKSQRKSRSEEDHIIPEEVLPETETWAEEETLSPDDVLDLEARRKLSFNYKDIPATEWNIMMADRYKSYILRQPNRQKRLSLLEQDESSILVDGTENEYLGSDFNLDIQGPFDIPCTRNLDLCGPQLMYPCDSTDNVIDGLDEPYPTIPSFLGQLSNLSLEPLLQYDTINLNSPVPNWPENTGAKQPMPPQSIYARRKTKAEALRRLWHPQKIRRAEGQTAALILRLLRNIPEHERQKRIQTRTPHEDRDAHETEANSATFDYRLNHLLSLSDSEIEDAKMETLRYNLQPALRHLDHAYTHCTLDPPPSYWPTYQEEPSGTHNALKESLASTITSILGALRIGKIDVYDATLAVSHNLLTSSAAPDVHVYNALITGFTAANQSLYTHYAILSCMRVPIRPNEITCTATLKHFTSTNRPIWFARYFALMRGAFAGSKDVMGLTLAHPSVGFGKSHGRGRERNFVRHGKDYSNNFVQVSDRKVIVKIMPTPVVMEAVLGGVIKFAGLQRAMDTWEALKADGWGLDRHGLNLLLRSCVGYKDWNNGIKIWKMFSDLRKVPLRLPASPVYREYYNMLALCRVCGKSQQWAALYKEFMEINPQVPRHVLKEQVKENVASCIRQEMLKRHERDMEIADEQRKRGIANEDLTEPEEKLESVFERGGGFTNEEHQVMDGMAKDVGSERIEIHLEHQIMARNEGMRSIASERPFHVKEIHIDSRNTWLNQYDDNHVEQAVAAA